MLIKPEVRDMRGGPSSRAMVPVKYPSEDIPVRPKSGAGPNVVHDKDEDAVDPAAILEDLYQVRCIYRIIF